MGPVFSPDFLPLRPRQPAPKPLAPQRVLRAPLSSACHREVREDSGNKVWGLAPGPCFRLRRAVLSRISRYSGIFLLFPGRQPGPSRGLSLMSSQGSVDSDHLGKLSRWVEEDSTLVGSKLRAV